MLNVTLSTVFIIVTAGLGWYSRRLQTSNLAAWRKFNRFYYLPIMTAVFGSGYLIQKACNQLYWSWVWLVIVILIIVAAILRIADAR